MHAQLTAGRAGRFLLALTIFIALAGLAPGQAQAATYTLNPTDDAYVSSISPTWNFGLSPYPLNIYTDGYDIYSYLKFDLSSIPNGYVVTQATLHLNMYVHTISGTGAMAELHQANPNWSEGTIKWENQPGFNATVWSYVPLTGTTPTGTPDNWVVWTVPNSGIDLIQDQLNLLLKFNDLSFDASATFRPDEYEVANVRPYLEIQANPVPLPGAVWLLGTGLLALAGLRKRR
jgi:hypothetical protein